MGKQTKPNAFFGDMYTIFGKVIDGFEVSDKMEKTPTGPGDKPKTNICLTKVTIHANPIAG